MRSPHVGLQRKLIMNVSFRLIPMTAPAAYTMGNTGRTPPGQHTTEKKIMRFIWAAVYCLELSQNL